MTYEQNYKFVTDMATVFLDEEDAIARKSDAAKTIYDDDHPAYGLFGFVYPQLFLKESRDLFVEVVNNEIRSKIINRARIKILIITALTGTGFIKQLENNLIDCLMKFAPKAPRALRGELRKLFDEQSILWFVLLASSHYNNRLIAHSAKVGMTQMIRTIDEASLSPMGQPPKVD